VKKQEEYKVELEVFEGPLDLLLYLIRKDEVDIYDIPIGSVTRQYMDYMNVMKMLDLNIAGEFLVMAATLMMIKSRMLLPVEERGEEDPEEDDPRWELVRQLVEYKKFKDMANQLQERELYQENVFDFGGKAAVGVDEDEGVQLGDVGIFDLISAFQEVLKNAKPEAIGEIEAEAFTVADKIDHVLGTIEGGAEVSFSTLFPAKASRNEIICTFLALLELLRLRQIDARQEAHCGHIVICRNDNPDDPPAPVGQSEMDFGGLSGDAVLTADGEERANG
jgi:segregation and condensation protein A